jgi:uncharacterized membrane protein
MGFLREGKAIGAAASTLLLIGFGTGPVNLLALLLGLILLLVAVKYVSQETSDKIFTNIMWAVVFVVTGAIVGFVIVFDILLSAVNLGSASVKLVPFTNSQIIGLVIVWIFFIIGAIFTWRSYSAIAKRLEADLFRTAATLFLIGAVLIIILGLGFIIIFAALAVQLAAFLSLPDEKHPRTPIDPWGKPVSPTSPSQPLKRP